MAERDRPVYCPRCGSIASVEDKFCGRCGGAIPTDVRSAASAQTTPAQTSASSSGRGSNLPLLIGLGVVALVVLGLGIGGTLIVLTLLRGEPENQGGAASPSKPGQQEEAGSVGQEATETSRDMPEKTNSQTPDDRGAPAANAESGGSQEQEAKPPEDGSGPTPGYNLIRTPDGSLSVEAPQSWGVETGEDSEKEAGPNTWSYYAGEYLTSSITTAPILDIWYSTGSSGAYMVASKSLAQDYTDYDLTHSLMFADKTQNCTTGPTEDYDRPPYSGTLQAWFDCGPDGADTYTIAAAPEGRECVVVLDARISEEADREAVEHLVNTFELDCGRVGSEELVSSPRTASAAATPSATATAPATAPARAETPTGACADPAYKAQNPGECGTTGYNPVSDPGDNYSQGVVVGDDTPDCARPEDVLESGLCAP